MKFVKIAVVTILMYVGIVVAFESLIGFFQPENASTIVITTSGADGAAEDRVVSPVHDGGHLYVSANHWPRSWYKRALENPNVQVTMDGQKSEYLAVPVTGAENERLGRDHAHSAWFRIVTGFPPREFLRLDPR